VLAKRLAAVIVAIVLVAGAFIVRARTHSGTASGAATSTHIVCATELAAACDALRTRTDVTVVTEPAAVTYERLVGDVSAEAPTVWIALQPWAQMVDDTRRRGGRDPLFGQPIALASSRLALVGAAARVAVVQRSCGAEPAWKCVGQANGAPWTAIGGEPLWRDVTLRHLPVDSGIGLAAFASGVTGWFGRADFTQADLDADPALRSWAVRLETFTATDPNPVPAVIERLRQTKLDLVATVAAETTADDTAARGLAVAYPSPMTRADAVLAPPAAGSVASSVVTSAASALRAGGWVDDGTTPSGLPNATTMVALLLFGRSVHQ